MGWYKMHVVPWPWLLCALLLDVIASILYCFFFFVSRRQLWKCFPVTDEIIFLFSLNL